MCLFVHFVNTFGLHQKGFEAVELPAIWDLLLRNLSVFRRTHFTLHQTDTGDLLKNRPLELIPGGVVVIHLSLHNFNPSLLSPSFSVPDAFACLE